jgi:hypothetical protein
MRRTRCRLHVFFRPPQTRTCPGFATTRRISARSNRWCLGASIASPPRDPHVKPLVGFAR